MTSDDYGDCIHQVNNRSKTPPPILTIASSVPPNCGFEVNDAEEPWNYSQKFDYIHGRAMVCCFSDPAGVINSAFESLRPSGYFEMQDPQMPMVSIDSSINGTALEEWVRVSCLAAERRGRKVTNSRHYGRWMAEAGFVDIFEKHFFGRIIRGSEVRRKGFWQCGRSRICWMVFEG
ncbi:hypothetical protein BPOR_0219g00080 [Botrytis porri]|uniref:Methyltransferase type 11 domain-containing protein n=1 Tax=Botrytis porri TaxID=87229 RepID=A0A4Z1KPS8_9HELO|nr:hypothetical protein BPOR_0219g00080 [Botrytis porri]